MSNEIWTLFIVTNVLLNNIYNYLEVDIIIEKIFIYFFIHILICNIRKMINC